jgi:zinc transport system substrate-binding protein
VALAGGCRQDEGPRTAAEIAVTNSYLQCVVQDLCPEGTEVLCLAPPGMCPGHFDIAPAQVRQLRNCRMLLLFDFQESVADRLTRLRDDGLAMPLVPAPAGLCVPDNYLATCQRVAAILSAAYPEQVPHFQEHLAAVTVRLEVLAAELRAAVAGTGLTAAPVLTSQHQEQFVRWLGLRPVSTFIGSDLETVAGIDHCLKQAASTEVRFVIANRQEGTSLAEALAERLQARAVVFSNFPASGAGDAAFDRLCRDNVELLLGAAAR